MDDPESRAEPPRADQAPGFLLMVLGRAMRDRVEEGLQPLGIGMRHYSALGHLAAAPGTSFSELARRAGITVQSMQATLQQLETIGAVERRNGRGRGRTAQLHVTDRGQDLISGARAAFTQAQSELLELLNPQDRRQLTDLLLLLLPALAPDATAAGGTE